MGDKPVPDEEDDQGANNGSDQARALIETVPPNGLADEGGQEGADNPKYRRQYESLRIVGTGRQDARNDSGNEADNDNPKDMHGVLRQLRQRMPHRNGGSITRLSAGAQLGVDRQAPVRPGMIERGRLY
jgi:hypothetical protein